MQTTARPTVRLVQWFSDLSAADVPTVGGKAASLGEMFGELAHKGVRIPNGFATTVAAFDRFFDYSLDGASWAALSGEAGRFAHSVLRAKTLRDAIHTLFADLDPSDHLELHTRSRLARAPVRATRPIRLAGSSRLGRKLR